MTALALDAVTLDTARRWAALAAALRVGAERSRDGGTAAALEQQATRCRIQFKRVLGGGIPFAEWDAERCLTAGQILRDAYTTARNGGAA